MRANSERIFHTRRRRVLISPYMQPLLFPRARLFVLQFIKDSYKNSSAFLFQCRLRLKPQEGWMKIETFFFCAEERGRRTIRRENDRRGCWGKVTANILCHFIWRIVAPEQMAWLSVIRAVAALTGYLRHREVSDSATPSAHQPSAYKQEPARSPG